MTEIDKEGSKSGTPAAPSPLMTVDVPTSDASDNDDHIITTESSLVSPTSIKLPSDLSQPLEIEQNTDPYSNVTSSSVMTITTSPSPINQVSMPLQPTTKISSTPKPAMPTELSSIQGTNYNHPPLPTGPISPTSFSDTQELNTMSTSSVSETLASIRQSTEASESFLLDNSDLNNWNSDTPFTPSAFTPILSQSGPGFNAPHHHQRQFLSPTPVRPMPTQYLPRSHSLPPFHMRSYRQPNDFVS